MSDPRRIFEFCAFSVAASVVLIFGFIFLTAVPAFQIAGIGFFLNSTWNYDTHQYGILYLILGTLFVTALSLVIVLPVGILTAIYLSDYASPGTEKVLRSLIELLVGIPSVVYGIFGFLVLNNFFRLEVKPWIGSVFGFIPFFRNVAPQDGAGYLLASCILAVMILPTIVALSQESLRSVPDSYREASYALGATKWETIHRVVIPAGISGIITAIVLGAMRAMGETMAVIMLIGGSLHMPSSILDIGTVMTAKIVGDAGYYLLLPESRSALFAIAATLFCMEILFVALIRFISRKFSERV